MNSKARRAPSTESVGAAAAAVILHIYFDLRTYALGRLVKRLLDARAPERQWPHLHRVFRPAAIVSFAIFLSAISSYSLSTRHRRAVVVHTRRDIRALSISRARAKTYKIAINKKKNPIFILKNYRNRFFYHGFTLRHDYVSGATAVPSCNVE